MPDGNSEGDKGNYLENFLPEKTMTFEQVTEESWEIAGASLETWKYDLEILLEEKASALTLALSQYSALYAGDIPDSVVVSLNYYPGLGRQKGEPVRNFWRAEGDLLPKDFPSILLWFSEPYQLPSDDPVRIKRENYQRVLPLILHELQHQFFQDARYRQLISLSEEKPDVQRVLNQLEGSRGTYIEVTNELITTYLESLGREILQYNGFPHRDNKFSSQLGTVAMISPFRLETSKRMHGKVMEAVIRADVEDWRDKGRHPGPYTELRQRWSALLGGLPKGYEVTSTEIDVTKPSGSEVYTGNNIYQVGRSLDTSLVRRYILEGRPIDVDFVRELYAMVAPMIKQDSNHT